MQRAMALQAQLQHRVLALVQHLHLLIPAVRSSAIRPEEEALRAALEEIDEEIRKPGAAGGRMHGKLNELWALVGAVHAAKERGRKGSASGTGADGNVEWAVVDDEGLGHIAQVGLVLFPFFWFSYTSIRYYQSNRQDWLISRKCYNGI
jgi:nuclear pore complex protein Nup54